MPVVCKVIVAANCTNCTGGEVDMGESGVSGAMVTGISVGFILLTIIMLSICYAKKWCCFMVRCVQKYQRIRSVGLLSKRVSVFDWSFKAA